MTIPRDGTDRWREFGAYADALAAGGRIPPHLGTPARLRVQQSNQIPRQEKFGRDLVTYLDGKRIALRIYEPEAFTGTVMFVHGGGWVIGSLDAYDAWCEALSQCVPARVVSVGYRLAPEHPFPAALDDVRQAYAWVTENFPDEQIAVVGDSAGGNLITAMSRSVDQKDRACAQVLVYPVLDTSRPFDPDDSAGLLLSGRDMNWFIDQYLPDEQSRRTTAASPLLDDSCVGAPPTLLVLAGLDPVRAQGLKFAEQLRIAGIEVEVADFPSMGHGFLTLRGTFEDAEAALDAISDFIRKHLAH